MSNKKKNKEITVSILTVTQHQRFDTLYLLAENILSQTYKDIKEWVIVEASHTKEESEENRKRIENWKDKMYPIEIVVLPFEQDACLGRQRNRGNDACQGDIIICMDDDDYYFKHRIELSVKALLKYDDQLICGCTDMLMYDMIVKRLYQFRGFGPRHSTNNCMAYRREYLENHRYKDNKKTGEEEEFTNNFTEPMIQIDPFSCVVQFSHSYNTYNKRDLVVTATLGLNRGLHPVQDIPIASLVDQELLQKYESLLVKPIDVLSSYDIIYFTGGFCISWSPYEDDLGGSEQAILHLSTEWVKQGQRVAVYTKLKPENERKITKNGVDYYCWKDFPYHSVLPNVVLWRCTGLLYFLYFQVTFRSLIVDLHDNISEHDIKILHQFKHFIRKIVLKSQYHIDQFKEVCQKNGCTFDNGQLISISNGVRLDMLKYQPELYGSRQKYRFCYTSCYRRGLVMLLQHTWPIIYRHEPRCELHVYYGMQLFNKDDVNLQNEKKYIQHLLSSPGVMDHGRQPKEIIKREKHLANFHLYFTSCTSETDCIAIKESIALGCIPLLSDVNVFKERDGIHFHLENEHDVKSYEKVAVEVLKLLRMEDDKLEKQREEGMKSRTLQTWKKVSNEWLSLFYSV
jgi:glycosyltransferase involved in cell wall biosynthesis